MSASLQQTTKIAAISIEKENRLLLCQSKVKVIILRIYLHTDEQNIAINELFDISLYKDAKKIWREQYRTMTVQNYEI